MVRLKPASAREGAFESLKKSFKMNVPLSVTVSRQMFVKKSFHFVVKFSRRKDFAEIKKVTGGNTSVR